MAIETGNSCTSVFPNTHAWEQQECQWLFQQEKVSFVTNAWEKGNLYHMSGQCGRANIHHHAEQRWISMQPYHLHAVVHSRLLRYHPSISWSATQPHSTLVNLITFIAIRRSSILSMFPNQRKHSVSLGLPTLLHLFHIYVSLHSSLSACHSLVFLKHLISSTFTLIFSNLMHRSPHNTVDTIITSYIPLFVPGPFNTHFKFLDTFCAAHPSKLLHSLPYTTPKIWNFW